MSVGEGMKKNVGGIDKAVRLIAGAALLVWFGMSGNYWGLLGLPLIVTAAIGWCPCYCPLKLSTACSSKSCCSGGSCEDKQPK